MANVYAVKSGNWSDPPVWNTGALPTSADDVYANNFTVTVDVSATVLSVRNTSGTGIVAGGIFQMNNNTSLTATRSEGFWPSTNAVLINTQNTTAGQAVTVNGNITGVTFSSNGTNYIITHNGGATLYFNGSVDDLTGGARTAAFNISSSGHFVFTGSILSAQCGGITYQGSGGMTLTGTFRGSHSAAGLQLGIAVVILSTASGTINIVGSLLGSTSNSTISALSNGSTGVTLIHSGDVVSGAAPAIGLGVVNQTTRLSGPLLIAAGRVASPCVAASWGFTSPTPATYVQTLNVDKNGFVNLYTANNIPTANYPTQPNVRSGTVYGPSNELTGTLAVPAPGSVALGVPVDATTGTAVLTAANIRSAVGLASANLDAQLASLDTNQTTILSNQATTLTNLAAVPAAVWAVLTSGLTTVGSIGKLLVTQLDAAISSRLAPSGTLARVTLTDTATAVTDTTGIANAVRSELSTELAHLDVDVSSRLAPGDTLARVTLTDTVTTVTDTAGIASAVRTELTPELERVANAATTQEVGDIVEGALQLPNS